MSIELPIDDSEEFVKWTLTEFDIDGETVMVAPLTGFYATPGAGKKEIRIAYVLNSEELKKACNILKEAVYATIMYIARKNSKGMPLAYLYYFFSLIGLFSS